MEGKTKNELKSLIKIGEGKLEAIGVRWDAADKKAEKLGEDYCRQDDYVSSLRRRLGQLNKKKKQ